jgi:hypothetical protein
MVYNTAIFLILTYALPIQYETSSPRTPRQKGQWLNASQVPFDSFCIGLRLLKLIQKAAFRMYGLPLRSPLSAKLGPGPISFLRNPLTSRFRRTSSPAYTTIHCDSIETDHLRVMVLSHGFKVNCIHEDGWPTTYTCTAVSYVGEKLEIWQDIPDIKCQGQRLTSTQIWEP